MFISVRVWVGICMCMCVRVCACAFVCSYMHVYAYVCIYELLRGLCTNMCLTVRANVCKYMSECVYGCENWYVCSLGVVRMPV